MRIADAIDAGRKVTGNPERFQPVIEPVGPQMRHFPTPPIEQPEPGLGKFMQCPLPPVAVAPDNLRSFYRAGLPQMRVLPPKPL